jgi:mono/diheme cytochrome c family protein
MRKLAWTCFVTAVVTCLGWLLLARPAQAGGWATFTLDHVPDSPRAGEEIDLSFVARGHGRTPFDLPPGDATFVFTNRETGESLTASATPTGLTAGHHRASIVLPSAGIWDWELRPSWYPPVEFRSLSVRPAASTGVPNSNFVPTGVTVAGSLLIVLVATILAMRDRRRRPVWVAALTGALLLALVAGLWLRGAIPPVHAQPAADHQAISAARGEALFIAKGCITCHYHGEMQSSTIIGVGPDLTHYKGSNEFLHLWLADPHALKPNTQMPNLGLQAAEIDALASFLIQQ